MSILLIATTIEMVGIDNDGEYNNNHDDDDRDDDDRDDGDDDDDDDRDDDSDDEKITWHDVPWVFIDNLGLNSSSSWLIATKSPDR